MKVSVLGAGNGGMALAFHLVQIGHEVLLYQDKKFEDMFQEIKESKNIVAVEEFNKQPAYIHGVSSFLSVTTDPKEACEFSDMLMLIVPAFAQKVIFVSCYQYLKPSHVFISLPGNFAFLDYFQVIHESSGQSGKADMAAMKMNEDLVTFVETSTIPYVCRSLGGNKVFISGMKKQIEVGVFPSDRADKVIELIKPLFTLRLVQNKNLLETGLCNLNFILHPPVTIYNAGWIESTKGGFLFYKEGLTPSVASLMRGLDKERVAIARALLLNVDDLESSWVKWYDIPDLTHISEVPEKAVSYRFVKAPSSLDTRFITEDLLYVLIPIISYLAKQLNVPTPIADAIISSARALTGLTLEPARHFDGCIQDYLNM